MTPIVLSALSLIFSLFSFACALYSIINIEAFKRSTHQVSFLDPSKQQFETLSEQTKEKLKQTVPDELRLM